MSPAEKNLERVFEALGGPLKARELAERLSVTEDQAKKWLDRGISARGLSLIAQRTGYSLLWLRDGIGPKLAGDTMDETVYVAVLNQSIEAGPGAAEVSLEYTRDYLAFSAQWLRGEVGHFERDSLAVGKVKGDSMFPLVRPGDVVLVDLTDTKPAADKLVVVYTRDRELILKRLEKHGEEWIAASENRDSESRSRKLKLGANGDVIKGKAFWRAGKI
jgi:phage repressor protein C with HTH and peptisase S24 domain